jgi:hypothetical protein
VFAPFHFRTFRFLAVHIKVSDTRSHPEAHRSSQDQLPTASARGYRALARRQCLH